MFESVMQITSIVAMLSKSSPSASTLPAFLNGHPLCCFSKKAHFAALYKIPKPYSGRSVDADRHGEERSALE